MYIKLEKYLREYFKEITGVLMRPESGKGIVFIIIITILVLIWNPNDITLDYSHILYTLTGFLILSVGFIGITRFKNSNTVVLYIILLLLGFLLILSGLGFLNV